MASVQHAPHDHALRFCLTSCCGPCAAVGATQRPTARRRPLHPTMRNLPSIPTTYRGIRYRSRLEARYASFFDALGWTHEYEPIDLDYYVPDFVLLAEHPVVVECKPFVPPFTNEDVAQVCQRLDHSGWSGDAIVVGAAHHVETIAGKAVAPECVIDGLHVPALVTPTGSRLCIGRMRLDGTQQWRDLYISRDGTQWGRSVIAAAAVLSSADFFAVRTMWADAGNETQWRKPEGSR